MCNAATSGAMHYAQVAQAAARLNSATIIIKQQYHHFAEVSEEELAAALKIAEEELTKLVAHEQQPYSGIYMRIMEKQLTGGDVLIAHMMIVNTATSFARADAPTRLCRQDVQVLEMVNKAIDQELARLSIREVSK